MRHLIHSSDLAARVLSDLERHFLVSALLILSLLVAMRSQYNNLSYYILARHPVTGQCLI